MKARVHLGLLSLSSGGETGQLHQAIFFSSSGPGTRCVCQQCDGRQVYLS